MWNIPQTCALFVWKSVIDAAGRSAHTASWYWRNKSPNEQFASKWNLTALRCMTLQTSGSEVPLPNEKLKISKSQLTWHFHRQSLGTSLERLKWQGQTSAISSPFFADASVTFCPLTKVWDQRRASGFNALGQDSKKKESYHQSSSSI